MAGTPTPTPSPLGGIGTYVQGFQMLMPLLISFMSMFEQLFSQAGHAVDAHPVLNDAKNAMKQLDTHVASVAAAAASSPSAS